MRSKRRLEKLFFLYLNVLLVSLTGICWYEVASLREIFYDQATADLEVRAHLAMQQIVSEFKGRKTDNVDALCKKLGKSSSVRITAILPSGVVVGDSEDDPSRMDNHADRPDVKMALAGWAGTSGKISDEMIYAAVPVKKASSAHQSSSRVKRASVTCKPLDLSRVITLSRVIPQSILVSGVVLMTPFLMINKFSPLPSVK